ncbi:hypothetical protein QTO34_004376 [Cnephaeus nilssonii]|uniref:Uncharacterized protein n=1 Tax=Cnephaeus nilssonii TaxID=3371016 RepID=A0AA40HP80_CNENI|nr:hypothetical protein QTO34_004376 [Eptesicus nilssonii]
MEEQRLKAALTHHPAAMSNGNMNTMGHMMEMMGSRQDQTPHHHMHSHPISTRHCQPITPTHTSTSTQLTTPILSPITSRITRIITPTPTFMHTQHITRPRHTHPCTPATKHR